MENDINSEIFRDLISVKMPFGRYKNYLICDLPENYLLWFSQKGFPAGKLGMLMSSMYEIRLNGLEYLITDLKKMK